jgi:hypothetical protein
MKRVILMLGKCQALPRPGLILAAVLLLAAGAAHAQNRVPPSVAAYERAMAESKMTVEQLFDLGEQAAHDLVRGSLSHFSQEEIDAVRKQMPGYSMANIEVVFALPQTPFFLDLSRRRGGPADVAFFEAMAVEKPDQSYVADYIQLTTHVQGCWRLDGALTRIDYNWRRYRDAYPHSYVRHVAEHLDKIEEKVSSSYEYKHICACGELPAAEQELSGLTKLGPQDRLGKSSADLLRGLRDGSVKFEANCRPN